MKNVNEVKHPNIVFLGRPGSETAELLRALDRLLGTGAMSCLNAEAALSCSRVHRLTFVAGGNRRSVVVKRFSGGSSVVERLATTRWLPAAGLSAVVPRLLAAAPAGSGNQMWHVYEDLGDATLDREGAASDRAPARDRGFLSPLARCPDPDRVAVVVRMIAEVHERFHEQDALAECRIHSQELGGPFLAENVSMAISALGSLEALNCDRTTEQSDVVSDLLGILAKLEAEVAWRCDQLEREGGGDTLLHGDLGVRNAFVPVAGHGTEGWLIDWDHAGVGPVSYDLSTFLMQLPEEARARTLETYIQARGRRGGEWPGREVWNSMFESHEYARLANCLIWPCREALDGDSEWAFGELGKIRQWMDQMEPVLPV